MFLPASPVDAWGGGCTLPSPAVVFFPLLKRYLHILELAQLFVTDAPIKQNNLKFSFTTSQSTFVLGR